MESNSPKFNPRNPAVKRILQEIKETQAENNVELLAEALEDDIFEWHFIIRGPPDTEFEGGIYHGRVLLPADYPFKPPGFMMLTPNGRFQTGMKICLSISSHHPEQWQPSWSMRTALMALIAFMPTPGAGALGSLDFTKEERRALALKSRHEVPKFGSPERQKIIDEMHQRYLELEAQVGFDVQARTASFIPPSMPSPDNGVQAPPEAATSTGTDAPAAVPAAAEGQPVDTLKLQPQQPAVPSAAATASAADGRNPGPDAAALQAEALRALAASAATAPAVQRTPSTPAAAVAMQTTGNIASGDWGLTLLAVALSVAIGAIFIRKVLAAMGYSAFSWT